MNSGVDANRLAGIYLLTPDADASRFVRVMEIVGIALAEGVRAVQYRDKSADPAIRLRRASQLMGLCRPAGALFVVNDSVDTALDCGADGVHVGRGDETVVSARSRLPDRVLGVSCYNDLDNARSAIAAGADAIAFGSVFASATKPAAVRAPLELLGQARENWPGCRVIAIGGINVDNIARVAQAGAHAAAVIDAVFGATNPMHAARALIGRFEEGRLRHDNQRKAL